MKDHRSDESKSERYSRLSGVILTVTLHALVFVLVSFSSLKYIYPPPEEKSILIDFTEESESQEQFYGDAPVSENPDKDKPVELAQRSESPMVNDKPNLTPQTAPDTFGDVPVPEIETKEKPALDPRASFPGMSKKDTTLTAAHSATESSDKFKGGQPDGNTDKGRTDGKPNAHIKGRRVNGNIPRPVYNEQESGIVVVDIWVDNYGNVVKAVPGGDGTTVMNKALLAAARNAALETHFNMSTDAPAMQEGTITYYFNLK
ncbi:MAG TPA: hypothetical protein DDX33_05275 [Rikenellaceae bacterium]|nr:hypothetical protein [Rikenellaceae bacterium]HBH21379.1 hypothetical protein [Rikenellaceae bacterium]